MMRGMAIVMIFLHNFCHLQRFALPENEFGFSERYASIFFERAALTPGFLYDVLSYLGWYGVPVFMFLSGYGLVKKYEDSSDRLDILSFLLSNYRKLVMLMIPGILFFIVKAVIVGLSHAGVNPVEILKLTSMVTLLNDPLMPWIPPVPGVYWYFGLTFEFYIIYALAVNGRSLLPGLILVAATLLLQFWLAGSPTLEWVRHNATGWLSVFIAGVAYARLRTVPRGVAIGVGAVAMLMFLPCTLNRFSWQLSLFSPVVFTIVLARLTERIRVWASFWAWIGRLSPFLFVAHPVVRSMMLDWFRPSYPSLLHLAAYAAAVVGCALIYRRVWAFTSGLFSRKSSSDKLLESGVKK